MTPRAAANEVVYKLVIVGESGVGKSCLMLRFADDMFSPVHLSTIGVDFKIRQMQLDGKQVKLQMWDTAGQERFQAITNSYFVGADGMMIVYDVCNRKTFERVQYWVTEVQRYAKNSPPCLLIGNKTDMTARRAVSEEEGRALAEKMDMQFVETSAKTSHNVEQAFRTMGSELLQKRPRSPINDKGGLRVLPDGDRIDSDGSGCCIVM